MKYIGYTVISALIAFAARRCSFMAAFMWIALVPFLAAVAERKKAVYLAGLFGVVYYGTTASWMFSIGELPEFGLTGGVGLAFSVLCWAGLTAYGAVGYMALFYILDKKHAIFSPWKVACGFMLLEGIQGWGGSDFAFPWCSLAYSQSGAIIQSASLFGSVFITFLIVFVNVSVWMAYHEKNRRFLWVAGSIFALNFVFGMVMLSHTPVGTTETVSVIQNNVASNEKWQEKDAFSALVDLKNAAKGDLIVFSETVYPSILPSYAIQKLNDENKRVLIGALSADEQDNTRVAMHMIQNGHIVSTSHKMHLIPFAEYMPPGFGFLSKHIGLLEFAPGESVVLHGTENKKILSLICFDSCFSSYAKEGVEKGASLLVVSTNDSWFDGSEEVREHFEMSAFRAVEQGRYLVHASTTGITGIVDPKGRTTACLPKEEKGVLEGEIQYIQTRTLYSYIGELPLLLCAVVVIYEKRRKEYAI